MDDEGIIPKALEDDPFGENHGLAGDLAERI
jgi:hypothetical protein